MRAAWLLVCTACAGAESVPYLRCDFESHDGLWQMLAGARIEATAAHGGARALRIEPGARGRGVAGTTFIEPHLRGRRVVLAGWIRTEGVTRGYATMILRAESEGETLIAAKSEAARATGSTPWTRYELALDVPAEMETLAVGALVTGDGTAWFDDLVLSALPQ
jgi:hypothetical protein